MPFTSLLPPSPTSSPPQQKGKLARVAGLGKPATLLYIALNAVIAQTTGLFYVLFPELGALSHGILKRPHGTWSRAPLMLVLTPFLTAVVGLVVARHLSYGVVSVFAVVGSAILIIRLLRSPIAPAISAGLLPLVLGITSWWYPPSLLIGTVLLAGTSVVWRRIVPAPPAPASLADTVDDMVEEAPSDYSWVPYFLAFLLVAVISTVLTGWRLLLFPPLVVIAFEMFAHPRICPWAGRPLILPIACVLSAAAGVLLVNLLGPGPLAAAWQHRLWHHRVARLRSAYPASAGGRAVAVRHDPSYLCVPGCGSNRHSAFDLAVSGMAPDRPNPVVTIFRGGDEVLSVRKRRVPPIRPPRRRRSRARLGDVVAGQASERDWLPHWARPSGCT